MRPVWPEDTAFKQVILVPESVECLVCQRTMCICDHRHHRIYTLGGPMHLVNKLFHCGDASCEGHRRTVSPEAELSLTMPWWQIGWDVFAWMGQRRFARHWSVAQIRQELADNHGVRISEDSVERYVRRYQTMVAARQQDPGLLLKEYAGVKDLLLTIDGLQPEKGHETLYVVRELRRRRVWFAEPLLSSATAEVEKVLERARAWSEQLGLPVKLWMSDKQDGFVKGIAKVFPGVAHRYCENHFVRDLAKPMLEADSAAKVAMRRKVRNLRAIEREVLADRAETETRKDPEPAQEDVVMDYCAAVRGVLNNDQGGPLQPPGLKMAEGLREIRASLQNNLDEKKGAKRKTVSRASRAASTAASRRSRPPRQRSSRRSRMFGK